MTEHFHHYSDLGRIASAIYDLAAIQGGNTAYTKVDEVVDKNDEVPKFIEKKVKSA